MMVPSVLPTMLPPSAAPNPSPRAQAPHIGTVNKLDASSRAFITLSPLDDMAITLARSPS